MRHARIARFSAVLIVLACSFLGCSSIKTTFFRRHEDETLCKENSVPIHGVPVMVKIPSHLSLRINETIHLLKDDAAPNVEILKANGNTIRTVDAQLRMTEKMFVLDPKRPLSGSGMYGLTFNSRPDGVSNAAKDAAKSSSGFGYLHGLQYKADDQTLANVSTFLANIAPILASPVAFSDPPLTDSLNGVYTTQRTIAFGLFDLGAPDFEEQVNAFLDTHLNHIVHQTDPAPLALTSHRPTIRSIPPRTLQNDSPARE